MFLTKMAMDTKMASLSFFFLPFFLQGVAVCELALIHRCLHLFGISLDPRA
jgi:hypothetical protein